MESQNQVIKKATKLVYLSEKVKRLKSENQFLRDVYAAMRQEYMPLLAEKYQLSQLARKLAQKLRLQRGRHRKNYAWLLRKYQNAKKQEKK